MRQQSYIDETLRSFLVKLGARSPEPAGGAALALAGASAAALMSLTCHADAASGDDQRAGSLETCRLDSERLGRHVQHLIDEDVRAYRSVILALHRPQASAGEKAERARLLDEALKEATEVPLAVAEAGLQMLSLAVGVQDGVRGPVLGDLVAAVHLAEAAVKGSLRNAHINVGAMSDRAYAAGVEDRITEMRGRLEGAAETIAASLHARGVAG
ncbi:MAG: cyclodeaminase/cyclohydrolase family protein [Actinobacteria bacterium]|nr:cyclodeaminase/cyclohydrolase family protein [Actinomycetota bacterium]